MPGKVERPAWITRETVQANRGKIFVFGDNLLRIGLGGQAAAMRNEYNTIGVVTKRAPGMDPGDFFSDKPDEFDAVRIDLNVIRDYFDNGYTIVIPKDGLGTGLSQLPTRSPQILEMINEFIEELEKDANGVHSPS